MTFYNNFTQTIICTVLGLALVGLFFSSCGNECSFHERCNGTILEICGEGPDQMVGREIHQNQCDSPNPFCVEKDDDASCVRSEETSCDSSFENYCEGSLLITCTLGHEQATDCTLRGPDCVADPDITEIPRCMALPVEPCSSDYRVRCNENTLVTCRAGFVEHHDCARIYEGGICVETTTSTGAASIYCQESQ